MARHDTPLSLAGRWAVVTGGSMGIGEGIATRFVDAGANVVVVARGRPALDTTVAWLAERAGPEQHVHGAVADVADRDSIDALFSELESLVPSLDIFVANAGIGHVTPFLELTRAETDAVVGLNLVGTLYCVQRAAQAMTAANAVARRDRSILVVSSIRALGARPGRLIYAATKAAVNQAVKVAAVELASEQIRVNTLSPGITETPLTSNNPAAFAEAVANVPLGRAGQPRDLADAALFLASPAAEFITGLNMVVDGGECLTV
jgi:glucose 1-dehydrogenase